MNKISFTETIANARAQNNQVAYFIADNWLQGRTTYGGMSAALCLDAALRLHDDLPPLRTVQINFTGPASGEVIAKTRVLRQGKSVCFIEVELQGNKGIATHAVLIFGAARESKLNHDFTEKAALPAREDCQDMTNPAKQPIFAGEFEALLATGDMPISGSTQHSTTLWIRHRDEKANDLTALLAVADMPPPAVLQMFSSFAPISSMTWSLNFLIDDFTTQDRWWLLESTAEHVVDGYSSQNMLVWNSDGKLAITARQNIAVFY